MFGLCGLMIYEIINCMEFMDLCNSEFYGLYGLMYDLGNSELYGLFGLVIWKIMILLI